jgi:hypothetical protein
VEFTNKNGDLSKKNVEVTSKDGDVARHDDIIWGI